MWSERVGVRVLPGLVIPTSYEWEEASARARRAYRKYHRNQAKSRRRNDVSYRQSESKRRESGRSRKRVALERSRSNPMSRAGSWGS